jgi:alpha-glucosidase
MEPVTWFLTGMQKHSNEFRGDLLNNPYSFEGAMRYHSAKMPYEALYTAMNELSNHDHSRFLTRTNMTPGRLHTHGAAAAEIGTSINIMMEAAAVQFVWHGAPTIYYGDEAGVMGWTDPDARRPYPWGKENKVLLEFHKELVKLHHANPCLRTGSLEYLHLETGVISFGRWHKDSSNKVACLVNNNAVTRIICLPLWKIGALNGDVFKRALGSFNYTFVVNEGEYTVSGGHVTVEMLPYSSVILTV